MTEPIPVTVPPTCPAHPASTGLTRIYDEAFAAAPHAVFQRLRDTYGQIAPVEIAPGVPAHLAIGYEAALELLRSPARFSRDPRRWEVRQRPDCEILPLMGYRPSVLFADGSAHERLRATITSSVQRLNAHDLRVYIEGAVRGLVARFGATGEADLVRDFSFPLSMLAFEFVFGCTPDIAKRMRAGIAGIVEFDDTEQANAMLSAAMMELVALKRTAPGNDVPSWMMEHPAALSDEEMVHQLILLMGAGIEPQTNLINNTMRQLFVDGRLADDLTGGSLSVEDAFDEVLWVDPPLTNYAAHYPFTDTATCGTHLPAAEPILISFAGANQDPAIAASKRAGNRAHIAWGAGPHACPAQNASRVIALTAVETLLDALPDIRLAVPAESLVWRPGPIMRGLAALPVRFTPVAPAAPAPTGVAMDDAAPWNRPSPRPAAAPASPPPAPAPVARRGWRSALARWWRGR